MNKRYIFTNGCFDVIHLGHLQLLNFCRKFKGNFVIGINSDSSIKTLKGNNRPINNQKYRKKFLEELNIADKVIIFNEQTPINLIKKIKPKIIIKANDYKKETVVGYKEIKEWKGKVIIFKKKNAHSTSKILKRVFKK
jgi:rfaE bifunctional protein nucleotidyltransferase chain/domain